MIIGCMKVWNFPKKMHDSFLPQDCRYFCFISFGKNFESARAGYMRASERLLRLCRPYAVLPPKKNQALKLTLSPETFKSCSWSNLLRSGRIKRDTTPLQLDSLRYCRLGSWSRLLGPETGLVPTSRLVKPLNWAMYLLAGNWTLL